MEKTSEASTLDSICQTIRVEGDVSDRHLAELVDRFGQRADKALEALHESRIKKYVFQPSGRTVWTAGAAAAAARDGCLSPARAWRAPPAGAYHGHVCY